MELIVDKHRHSKLDAAYVGQESCNLFCVQHTHPWNTKCTWDKDCNGCSECEALEKANLVRSGSTGKPATPRVYFLFMVRDGIMHLDIWQRFFAAANPNDYRVFVHCVDEEACKRKSYAGLGHYVLIPTVPSSHCTNLVEPMNALLRASIANEDTGHKNDKFVFVSGSTVPVKPWSVMRRQLTSDDNSDFCVFPAAEWAAETANTLETEYMHWYIDALRETGQLAIKTHQWSTLSRLHAQKCVNMSIDRLDLARFHPHGNNGGPGCIDEYWHFFATFGSFQAEDTGMTLTKFNGGPIDFGSNQTQGRCDTFAAWDPMMGQHDEMTRLMAELDADGDVIISRNGPRSYSHLSEHALSAFRKSSFLFARKIDEYVGFSGTSGLTDAFERLVFKN